WAVQVPGFADMVLDISGRCVRMFPADLGQAIIGDAGKLDGHRRRTNCFQWRIGKREDLPQAVKAFDEPQTGADVDERVEPRERRYRIMIGNELGNTCEIRPRHEMVKYVDDQSRPLARVRIRRAEFAGLVEHRARRSRYDLRVDRNAGEARNAARTL